MRDYPRFGLATMVRLGLFQAGLGMMSVLMLGILNRVMISELAIPPLVTAGVIAMHQLVAPARVWFGQMSDARPVAGTHRTGYVWLGAGLLALLAWGVVQITWQVAARMPMGWDGVTWAWVVLLGLGFALYGLAVSASSTPFAALLVDISDEDNRSQLVGVVWSLLMVGIIVGAIVGSGLLKQVEVDAAATVVRSSMNRLFTIVPLGVVGLAVAATVGVERQFSRYRLRSQVVEREDQITLGRALRVLTASPQTGLFFSFLLCMTLGLFMQEPVLEPYGGAVFGMPIAATTRLNAYWGLGTLLGLGVTGFLIVPRIGKRPTTMLGCGLVALSFVGIMLAGWVGQGWLFTLMVFAFGLAAGVTTTGALTLMLDLTLAETAGTFIGAWGLAQALARALATLCGGGLLELGSRWFGAGNFWAYVPVFGIQILLLLGAITLLRRVDVQAFTQGTRAALGELLVENLE
ncbi:PUCC protein [Gloeomargarita lithophora Alchichica-D10]|uniref:PUCC protein n=1 Tax=Gloeomargarita lithophora Alchichica-D10 TaxID=1188229 RepID=A0A1J0AD82_9CYAN|nr:BCD family MFS transporter [Gloeomargarita lithophora]APB33893.1 PUCC protein [Gloeomargarita lithophora Alchichica-D10]